MQNRTKEQAILVGLATHKQQRDQAEEHLAELALLAKTAGASVVKTFLQYRSHPDPATLIGKGKVQQISEFVQRFGIPLVIFDQELSPSQARNLEKALQAKIIDRTQLILQIFAQHARTREARTQVELAQLEYLLPRLTRLWTHLSKQYGGIGTKGPGEKQIEMDRRLLRNRIATLKRKLQQISQQRQQQRKRRNQFFRFSLVGYTNAGKSTLAEQLTNSPFYTANQLFATLDTVTRRIVLPNGHSVLLSDTVGFIRKLPPSLIASFHSTLAEILEADALLHVVDISHPAFEDHIAVVHQTLEQLGAHHKPMLIVFNKIDALNNRLLLQSALQRYPQSIAISAQRGINLTRLLEQMEAMVLQQHITLTLRIPYAQMPIVSQLYAMAAILQRREEDDGIYLTVQLPSAQAALFQSYRTH